jgi:DNA invertase Pin-like site-specific DNA recombinase
MPTADPFRLHIEAAIAEEEARKISARTKSALAMARARGVTLGGYRGYVPDPVAAGLGAERSRVARQAKSRARAIAILPVLEELRSAGVVSVSGLAVALNARSIPAPRGGSWQAVQVARVLSQGT